MRRRKLGPRPMAHVPLCLSATTSYPMRPIMTSARHPSIHLQPQPRRPDLPETLQSPPFAPSPTFSAKYVGIACHPAAPPTRYLIAHLATNFHHVVWFSTTNPRHPGTTKIMSGWGLGWFGGGQAKKEAPKKAILQLRGQLEMLNKREKHLQNQMDEQDTIARKYVSSNKNGNLFPTASANNHTNIYR